jgi:hypothetical protein
VTATLAPLPPVAHDVGALTFGRYAFPPNQGGYCGPGDPAGLLEQVAAGVVDDGLRARARGFDGAWPYLELIARAAGVADPLDPRVVTAYWLGAPPIERVRLRDLADHVDARFRPRAGTARWGHLAAALAPGAVPDHAFHVLAVYPWVGLLREGVTAPSLEVISRCCIRPARVEEVRGEHVEASVPAFSWDGRRLRLADDERIALRWASPSGALVAPPAPGDLVAAHWDWACDRLTGADAARLRRRLAWQARAVTA